MSVSAGIPQFTIDRDLDARPLLELVAELRVAGEAATASDLISAACARALRRHPEMNASFDGDAVVQRGQVNLGIAIAIADGLVAPCIEAADRLTLRELAAARRRLARAAKGGRLEAAQLLNATFTISNLGPLGVRRFRALVTPPQAGILAVGAIGDGVVKGEDRLELGPTLSLALSCDHRAVDGAPAARFLASVSGPLEDPHSLL